VYRLSLCRSEAIVERKRITLVFDHHALAAVRNRCKFALDGRVKRLPRWRVEEAIGDEPTFGAMPSDCREAQRVEDKVYFIDWASAYKGEGAVGTLPKSLQRRT